MRTTRFVAAVCLAWLFLAAPMEGQDPVMTEQEAVRALAASDLVARHRAVDFAWRLGSEAGPDLRAALIKAAMEEVRGETGRPDIGEAVFTALTYYADALAPLREPGAVPFFLEMLRYGSPAADAVADIGAAALSGVLSVVTDTGTDVYVVHMALIVLRFMVEDGWPGPEELAAIREAARDCLTGKHGSWPIREAMFLAATLDDPELLAIVATLASDRSAVDAIVEKNRRFFLEPTRELTIEALQEHARHLLSGTLSSSVKRRPRPEGE